MFPSTGAQSIPRGSVWDTYKAKTPHIKSKKKKRSNRSLNAAGKKEELKFFQSFLTGTGTAGSQSQAQSKQEKELWSHFSYENRW